MQISNRTVYAALVLAALLVVGLVSTVLGATFGAMPDNALDRLKASFVSGNPAAADGDPIQRVALWIPPGGASGTITVAASSAAGITNPVNVTQFNGTTFNLGNQAAALSLPVTAQCAAASCAVNLSTVNGTTVTNATGQTVVTGIVPVGGVRSITFGDAAVNAPTDFVGALAGYTYAFNGSTWDRVRIGTTTAALSLPVNVTSTSASAAVQIADSNGNAPQARNWAAADANAANTGLIVNSVPMGYNAGNNVFDRCRSGGQANVSASTGLCVSLPVGQYNATANAITDSRFNHFQLDANGSLRVNPAGQIPTYAAASAAIALATSPTDVFTITGSSTKTVKVRRIVLSGVQTTAGAASMSLILRSTANSGGTSVTPAVTPLDFNDAAGTATVRAYTANPTVGTQAGVIDTRWMTMLAPATAAETPNLVFDFSERSEKAVVLRGTTQVLAVNFHGTTVTGGSVSAAVTWTEE